MKRLSTHSFALRAAPHLDDPAKFLETLSHPMLRDILETMDAHEAALFFILGPVQFFKSLAGQLRLARNHALRPRKAGWYAPTEAFAKDFADTKLNPLLEVIPELRDIAILIAGAPPTRCRDESPPIDKTKQSKMRRTCLGGASHLLLSATTENDRTGKTFEDVYLDEPHLYEPGWIEQIFNRTADYPHTSTKTLMSTGMTRGQDNKGGEAAALWDNTDQRTWHSKCPKCEKFFEPRYAHYAPDMEPSKETQTLPVGDKNDDLHPPAVRDAGVGAADGKLTRDGKRIIGGLIYDRKFLPNGLPDEAAIAATLRYRCPHCGAEFKDNDGTRLALNGTYEQPLGKYIAQNPTPAARHFGWTFNSIAGRPWLPIVIEFEKAILALSRGDFEPLAKLIREKFGGIWNPIEYLREKRLDLKADYAMGQRPGEHTPWPDEGLDPLGRPYRLCTVDVQRGWFRVLVRAWNNKSESRLLWADEVSSPGRIKEICDALAVIPERVVLDRRYNKEYVRQNAGTYGWRTLFGEKEKDYLHPDGIRRVISTPEPMDPFQGTIHAGRCQIIENKFAKWTCLSRLDILRKLQNRAGQKLFTAPADAPDWYFREMEAYTWMPKVIDGTDTGEWRATGPDHSPDCECMGIAVAAALKLTGAESIEVAPQQTPEEAAKAAA